jgi:hypothetical protein
MLYNLAAAAQYAFFAFAGAVAIYAIVRTIKDAR